MVFRIIAMLLSLFVLPGLMRGITGKSMALGTLLGILVITASHVKTYRIIFTRTSVFYTVLVILIIGIINISHSSIYSIGVLFIFLVFLFSCIFIAGSFEVLNSNVIDRHFYSLLLLLLVISLIQIGSDFKFLQYSYFPKTLAFYSEPSHLIVGLAPLIMFSFLRCRNQGKMFIFVSLLFIGIFSPSVISLFMVIFVLPLWLGPNHKILRLIAFTPVIYFVFFAISQFGDAEYIFSRLDFSGNENLTVLTYLQGWEEIKRILLSEHYLGVGIGNSTNWSVGTYGELIYKLLDDYKNREDLGFLAAKIIVELGWAGLVLVVYLSSISIRSYFLIFKSSGFSKSEIAQSTGAELFSHVSLACFILELFVRGSGYITSGVFLFILGNIIINKKQVSFHEKKSI